MKLMITGHQGFVGTAAVARTGADGLVDSDGKSIDLKDAKAVARAVASNPPDHVIHLAAQTFVPDAFRDPRDTYEVNFVGTHNLLTALKQIGFKGRFLFVSSSDVYGPLVETDLPATESTPLNPLNPYAVSKIAAEALCRYWCLAERMDIVVARSFNHIGPGQSPRFALADFSKTIVEIRKGLRDPVLSVGDLDVTRDFTDYRDVIEAYLRLLDRGRTGEIYNVCSGREHRLKDAVYDLARLAGIGITLTIDPARCRKASQRRALGSAEKLKKDTGWTPVIRWEQSLTDMLNFWETSIQ